jgi:hypothetical protein
VNWHLNEEEKDELRLRWLRKSISRVELIEKDYFLKKDVG